MKRKFAGLLVCALCLTLSACGSSAEESAAVVTALEAFFNGWIESHH